MIFLLLLSVTLFVSIINYFLHILYILSIIIMLFYNSFSFFVSMYALTFTFSYLYSQLMHDYLLGKFCCTDLLCNGEESQPGSDLQTAGSNILESYSLKNCWNPDVVPQPPRFIPKRTPGVQPPLNCGNPSAGEIFSHFFMLMSSKCCVQTPTKMQQEIYREGGGLNGRS